MVAIQIWQALQVIGGACLAAIYLDIIDGSTKFGCRVVLEQAQCDCARPLRAEDASTVQSCIILLQFSRRLLSMKGDEGTA